jgi:hypothetical protein
LSDKATMELAKIVRVNSSIEYVEQSVLSGERGP